MDVAGKVQFRCRSSAFINFLRFLNSIFGVTRSVIDESLEFIFVGSHSSMCRASIYP